MTNKALSRREDFEARFRVTPGCWIWTSSRDRDGYGKFYGPSPGKVQVASRFSYELYVGKIPEGMHVLHRCDNRCCVNPEHLSVGTNFDNVIDKINKGRQLRGTMFSWAKLDEDKVQQIRADTRPQRQIAKDFGISRSAVSEIKTRKKWKHVPERQASQSTNGEQS
jgi:predicted XRE-type DNA-binding protein